MKEGQGNINVIYPTLTTGAWRGEEPATSTPARQGSTVLLLSRGTGRFLLGAEDLAKTLPLRTVSLESRLPCSTPREHHLRGGRVCKLLLPAWPLAFPPSSPTQGLPRRNPALLSKSQFPCALYSHTQTHRELTERDNTAALKSFIQSWDCPAPNPVHLQVIPGLCLDRGWLYWE